MTTRAIERRGAVIKVPSDTVKGHSYSVLVDPDPEGGATCTCAGYEFWRRECKHIEQARRFMTTDVRSQALVVRPPTTTLPTEAEYAMITHLSKTVASAKGIVVPAELDSPEKVATVLLAGWEMGIKPMTALRHLYIVKGRIEPSAQLLAGIIMAREPDSSFEIVELTEERCTLRFNRPQKNIYAVEYTYTLGDATTAGLVKPDSNWKKFPKDMLRWAATKRLARAYASDLINGIPTTTVGELPLASSFEDDEPDESPRDNVIEGEYTTADLYSEGDKPDEDGVIENVPTTSEQQRRSIDEWLAAIEGKHSKATLTALSGVIKERYSYALNESKAFKIDRLTQADAESLIQYLHHVHETKDGTVAFEGDFHEWQYVDEKAELMRCDVCKAEKRDEAAASDEPQQPAMPLSG